MPKTIATIRNIDEEIFNVTLSTWRMSAQQEKMDKIQHNLAVILDLLMEKNPNLKEWTSC